MNSRLETANHIATPHWCERTGQAADKLSVADRQRILSAATVCGTPTRLAACGAV
jgi:hypothetical protein